MGKGLNQCNFIGNVGRDPEIKYTPSGTAVANFSLAVDESYKKDGQSVDKTEWVRVVAWGKLAEIIGQYVTKGKPLFISGRLQTRSYEKDGATVYATEIVASEMKMLGGRDGGEATNARRQAQPPLPGDGPPLPEDGGIDDDIPF